MRSENINADIAGRPENLSVKAKLAWQYFFEGFGGWIAVKTDDGRWIVMDEGFNLNKSIVFPDEDSFVQWLEVSAEDHLIIDTVDFLKCFVSVPDIIDESVSEAILKRIESVDCQAYAQVCETAE